LKRRPMLARLGNPAKKTSKETNRPPEDTPAAFSSLEDYGFLVTQRA